MPGRERSKTARRRRLRRGLVALALLGGAPVAAPAQLSVAGAQFWHGDSPGLTTPFEANLRFGRALASGDFDGDGFGDLAVGLPGASVNNHFTAGAVLVLYGGGVGPVAAGHQVWTQDDFGTNPAENFDFFGTTLAAGDFDGDGFDDLAVGVPNEAIGSFEIAGIVEILYGGAGGLAAAGAQVWSQDVAGIPGDAGPSDSFGSALAVADFDDDGFDDLAIGADRDPITTNASLGAVHVLFGSGTGLTSVGNLFFQPGDGVVTLDPETAEFFGAALATCRLAPGGSPALAVGVPFQTVGAAVAAGAVVVLGGLDGAPQTLFVVSQDTAGVPGVAETGDHFGSELACGDFDRDGDDDLAVGVPSEAVETDASAGSVNVIETGPGAVHTLWHEDVLAGSSSAPNEVFGAALAAADFDADGAVDLAIGAPGETVLAQAGAGTVFVLYGVAGSGLAAAGHQVLTQAVDSPESGDGHGSALAAGRLSGHSGADLAIGAPNEDVASLDGTGAAGVLFSIALFRDGFETGDTSAWSAAVP